MENEINKFASGATYQAVVVKFIKLFVSKASVRMRITLFCYLNRIYVYM